jgi:hypothetical protein
MISARKPISHTAIVKITKMESYAIQQSSTPIGCPLHNSNNKKPQRVWKPKKSHPKLALGMDVGLSEACNLALCALVGRLAYKDKCNLRLEDWITAS